MKNRFIFVVILMLPFLAEAHLIEKTGWGKTCVLAAAKANDMVESDAKRYCRRKNGTGAYKGISSETEKKPNSKSCHVVRKVNIQCED